MTRSVKTTCEVKHSAPRGPATAVTMKAATAGRGGGGSRKNPQQPQQSETSAR